MKTLYDCLFFVVIPICFPKPPSFSDLFRLVEMYLGFKEIWPTFRRKKAVLVFIIDPRHKKKGGEYLNF